MPNIWIDTRGTTPIVSGDISVKRAISSSEKDIFGLTDEGLKNIIAGFGKKKPDGVWIAPPAVHYSGGAELFAKYNITPVNINLRFDRGTIKQTTSVPEIVQRAILTNNSSQKGIFHADLSVTKTQVTSNTFESSSSLTVGFKAGVKCKIISLETSLEYSYTWGESHTESSSVALGTSSGVQVELAPGQSVEASLVAKKKKSVAEIVYKAFLSDRCTIYYKDKYAYNGNDDKHNIWFPGIPSLMREIVETVTIDTYGETEVVIRDRKTNQELDLATANGPIYYAAPGGD